MATEVGDDDDVDDDDDDNDGGDVDDDDLAPPYDSHSKVQLPSKRLTAAQTRGQAQGGAGQSGGSCSRCLFAP